MSCSSPTLIRNPKTKEVMQVPCGHCVLCLANRSNYLQWLCRKENYYQSKLGRSSSFVTLTYDDEHIPLDNNLDRKYMQDFLKRFRWHLHKNYADLFNGFKYFGVGEYGDLSNRMHMHILVFGVPSNICDFIARKSWCKGFVSVDTVCSSNISYLVNYVVYERWTLEQVQRSYTT